MEIVANSRHGVSAFYRAVTKTDKGLHMGFVCDAKTDTCARIRIVNMVLSKQKSKPFNLISTVFNGVSQ